MNENIQEQNESTPMVVTVQQTWKQKVVNTAVQIVVITAIGIATEMAAQMVMDAGRKAWESRKNQNGEVEEIDESIEEL